MIFTIVFKFIAFICQGAEAAFRGIKIEITETASCVVL